MGIAKLSEITAATGMRSAAQLYWDAGLDPIPIHGVSGELCTCGKADCGRSAGKHPVGAHWETRPIAIAEFVDPKNIGLRMGGAQKLIALDVDGATGEQSLVMLQERLGELPTTLTSRSGSGGQHLLFRTRAVEQIRNSAKKLASCLDVRSQGGQIVVAPSLHLSGRRYSWTVVCQVAELPEAWEAEILRLNQTQAPTEASPPTGDRNVIERARAYIATMPSAISGSGGHNATWDVAQKLIRFGLSDSDAMALMREYNLRCEPPWSERELRHKVQSARAQAQNREPIADRPWDPPHRAPAQPEDEDVEREAIQDEPATTPKREPEQPKQDSRLYTVQQLLSDSLDRTKHPLDGRERCTTGLRELDDKTGALRRGFVWIMGAETSFGKSSLAIAIADDNLRKGKRVLICSAEDRETVYADRLMCRRARVSAARLRDHQLTERELERVVATVARAEPIPVFLDAIGMNETELCKNITACCKQHGIDLVIVDYLQSIPQSKKYQDRRERFTETALAIGHTTKGLDVPLLLLSQITPGDELNKYSIRESKDVPNAAEVVILGFDQAKTAQLPSGRTIEAGTKCLKIDKAKDGQRGLVELNWNRLAACFVPESERWSDDGTSFDGQLDGYGTSCYDVDDDGFQRSL